LLVAIVGAFAIALAVAVTAFSFLLGGRLDASATALARAEAEAELSSLEIVDGVLLAPAAPDDGTTTSRVWVFAGSRVLVDPNAPSAVEEAARSLAGGPARSLDIGEETRLFSLPIIDNGTRQGTVVSAVSLRPYEETGQTALVGAIVLALLLLGAVFVLSRWLLGHALQPVSKMTEDAAAWSEHDLDRRFDLGEPHDELTRLASTLDDLLERSAASLRYEQRLTAELSHELRTPLTRISGQAELMLRRERSPEDYRVALAAIRRNAEQMTRTVEALVAAARQEAGLARTTSDARDAVEAAVRTVREMGTTMDLRVALPREPARVAADEELVERMVQPLLDNAVRYGRSAIDVSLVRNGAYALVRVVDDGPGVAEHEQLLIFEPGVRGTGAIAASDGAGLGLSLARRLARSAGGEITATAGNGGGDFTLRLPLTR